MKAEELSDVLSEFARTMVTDFPIQRILDHLVKRIVEVLPITAAGVTLISPEHAPRYVAASNDAALRFEKLQTDLGEGPCLAAYETGLAISVPDLSRDVQFPSFSPHAVSSGLAAVFTFPLNHGDSRLGALDLYRDSVGPLTARSLTGAQTLADVAAAYIINAQARSDLEDTSDRSREAALHDPLTGLPNRTLLLERLEHAFLRAQRSGKISAVFFLDLNRFKAVNDSYGHSVGDLLLVAVTDRLAAMLRPGDTLARLAGDEFVIVCEELDDPDQARAIAGRIDAELDQPFALPAAQVTITASIGIAFTGRDSDSAEQLLREADRAMYQAKRHRERRAHVFDLRELHLAEDHSTLARTLPGAIARNELTLAYQPIVASASGRLTAVEALIRWTPPDRSPVSPTVLIPLAEQTGLIGEIGRWVLQRCCSDRQQWQRQTTDEVGVSVNLSAHQFMLAGLADTMAGVLDVACVPPSQLTLEVTEEAFVRDHERAVVVLDELHAHGVKLALANFGSDGSSLNHLVGFHVDTVKIARDLIARLDGDRATHTIVGSIVELAHDLGMTVVCEGVETEPQHRALQGLGCDCCQGYYFARPMLAAGIDALITSHTNAGNPCFPASTATVGAPPS